MEFLISRSYTIQAAHHLTAVPPTHKCAAVHGHTYNVKVTLGGELDPALGWHVDFAEIDQVFDREVFRSIDHSDLNLVLPNPTTELLALWIWAKLVLVLGPDLHSLDISENDRSNVHLSR